jgi:hypothetical protein
VEIREIGSGAVIFEEVQGGDANDIEIATEKLMFVLRNEFGVETRRGYAKYQISPKEARTNNSTSEIGVFLEEEYLKRLIDLERNFDLKRIDRRSYIVAEFPYKTRISTFFASIKVYKAFDKFVEKNGYSRDTAVIEIEDISQGRALYLKEMARN